MTRIVYYSFTEGGYITQKMVAVDSVVHVQLQIINNHIEAAFYKNNELKPFKSIYGENVTSLKKKVKKELVSLGVNFSDEVRPNLKRKLKGEKK